MRHLGAILIGIFATALALNAQVDMLTCVYVGNSQTRVIDGRMVTPRGYQWKAQ